MIHSNTSLGAVNITNEYFASIVGNAVANCYGVAGLATGYVRSHLFKEAPDAGIAVAVKDGRLSIAMHIKVTYGVNILTIVESINQRVKYAVEKATGYTVHRIDVYVDDIVG